MADVKITDEMVEVGAEAALEARFRDGEWQHASPAERATFLAMARDTITAVCPLIAAQVRRETLEEAAKHLERQPSFGDGQWAARHIRALAEKEGEIGPPPIPKASGMV